MTSKFELDDILLSIFETYVRKFGVEQYRFLKLGYPAKSSFEKETGKVKYILLDEVKVYDKNGNKASRFSKKYVKDDDFYKTIFHMFHEVRHVEQFNVFAQDENNEFGRQIVQEYLAINKNPLYYKNNKVSNLFENYYYMLMEVDAEKYAVKRFYNFLNEYLVGET